MIKIILLISILCFYFLYNIVEGFDDTTDEYKKELFNNLMKDFKNIFPDNNRNAGGVQFFHHILNNIRPNKRDFDLYNTFYCAVSGSPIDPMRKNAHDLIKIKDLNGNDICGTYYRCCIPCNCDIMKYGLVEKMNLSLKDGEYEYNVITIPDPCENEDEIPNEVTSFVCSDNKTQNGVHSPSGRLIVGLLYDTRECSQEDIDSITTSEITGDYCKKRNSLSFNEIRGGMGDIFVKLASLGKDNSIIYTDVISN